MDWGGGKTNHRDGKLHVGVSWRGRWPFCQGPGVGRPAPAEFSSPTQPLQIRLQGVGCAVLLWAAEGQLPGRPCPCSSLAHGPVAPNCQWTNINTQFPVRKMWGSGRHGKFRRTPIGATNNLKAERGKNNDCYHNKKLCITKNDGQTSHILQSISQF